MWVPCLLSTYNKVLYNSHILRLKISRCFCSFLSSCVIPSFIQFHSYLLASPAFHFQLRTAPAPACEASFLKTKRNFATRYWTKWWGSKRGTRQYAGICQRNKTHGATGTLKDVNYQLIPLISENLPFSGTNKFFSKSFQRSMAVFWQCVIAIVTSYPHSYSLGNSRQSHHWCNIITTLSWWDGVNRSRQEACRMMLGCVSNKKDSMDT